MNRQEITDIVSQRVGVTKKETEEIINAFLDVVAEDVAAGNKVQLMGFGSWETKKRAARVGQNPQTGESINIPACVSPIFKPSKVWKDKCNK